MADLRKEAQRARKRVEGLDFSVDLDQLRGRLPDNLAWSMLRQREDEAESRGFFAGFLLGAVVGAVLALIFAPQRGEETRGMVMHKATDLVHQVRGEGNETRVDLSAEAPAIEREFGEPADPVVASTEVQVNEVQPRS